MKTVMMKLRLGVLLTGLVILASCSNPAAVGSSAGINVIYRAIPVLAKTVTNYSEQKIAEYLKSSSITGKGTSTNGKKIEKTGGNQKTKPISISISRDARLV